MSELIASSVTSANPDSHARSRTDDGLTENASTAGDSDLDTGNAARSYGGT